MPIPQSLSQHFIRRFPKILGYPKSSKLDNFSSETHGFGDPPILRTTHISPNTPKIGGDPGGSNPRNSVCTGTLLAQWYILPDPEQFGPGINRT